MLEFNNSLWILGGHDGTGGTGDVWTSTDGVNWTLVAATTPKWTPRYLHAVAVFAGKMWVLGGNDTGAATGRRNDVWSSSDGAAWTQETPNAAWSGREALTVLVYNNALWLTGGRDSVGTHYNSVWTSVNGSTWTQVTTVAPIFSARRSVGAAVFDNKMWIMGGVAPPSNTLFNDVWWSTDGANWTAAQTAPWSARHGFGVAVLGTEMYVMGGDTGSQEVWSTTDGQNWTQLPGAPWGSRRFPGVVSPFNGNLWLAGGLDSFVVPSVYLNDVWSFSLGQPKITSTAPTTATVGTPYTYTVVATGNPTPQITTSPLPSWLMFDNIDTISGTPTAADIGMTPMITVAAANTLGTATEMFQITIDGVPPQITSTPVTTANASVPYTYTVVATGAPAPTLSTGTLPGWLNFNPTTGELSGTPGAGDVGTAPQIDITAANGWAPDDTQMFTITVNGVAPTITSTPVTTATVGSPYTYTVVANGIPTPTLSAGTLPGWLTFNPGTGELSGTPAGSDIGVSAQIDITAANTVTPDDVQSFTITVSGVAPTFTSSPVLTATPGKVYTYTAVATGTPAPTLSATSVLPAWMTFNPTSGILTGTPTNSDAKTTVAVTLTATNGVSPDGTQTFNIAVDRSPDAKQSDNESNGCSGNSGIQAWALGVLALLLTSRAWRRSAR
jgi:hypothetical protein